MPGRGRGAVRAPFVHIKTRHLANCFTNIRGRAGQCVPCWGVLCPGCGGRLGWLEVLGVAGARQAASGRMRCCVTRIVVVRVALMTRTSGLISCVLAPAEIPGWVSCRVPSQSCAEGHRFVLHLCSRSWGGIRGRCRKSQRRSSQYLFAADTALSLTYLKRQRRVLCQPRATPWVQEAAYNLSPERAA
jgi:hypothetical protein